MAALMVPFGLKSLVGLYPESCRFLIYSARSLLLTPPGTTTGGAPTGACANAGVAAVADSSTAAARVLNETIVVFSCIDRLQIRVGTQHEVITLREASVLFERELSACGSDTDAAS